MIKQTILIFAVIVMYGTTNTVKGQTEAGYISDFKFNSSMYFGAQSTIGASFAMNIPQLNPNLRFGWRISAPLEGGGIGTNYSEIFGPNTYKKEIYEVVESTDYSGFLSVEYELLDRITVGGLIGLYETSTKYNAYDNSQILSPSGYYYTSNNVKTHSSVGITSSIELAKIGKGGVGTILSYTTSEKFTAGVSVTVGF
jgi:hypothetical protein